MTFKRWVQLYIFVLFCIAIVLLASPSWADERRYDRDITVNSNNTSTIDRSQDVTTTVNADSTATSMMSGNSNDIVFDSKAYVMGSHSLGDVDINQCIVTKQTGTFIISWQGYDYNAWCMGEVYDAKGLAAMGAMMRCDIPVIRRHFTNDIDCLDANTVQPVEIVESPKLANLYNQAAQFDEHYNLAQQQEKEIEYLQEEQASVVGRLEQIARYMDDHDEPVVEQDAATHYSDEQFDAVWSALKGEENDDE